MTTRDGGVVGAFFKPWRRKIGFCTLVMACLLAAGWLRSSHRQDGIGFDFGHIAYGVGSATGEVDFYRWTYNEKPNIVQWPHLRFSSQANLWANVPYDPWPSHEIEWRWDWFGFHFGVANVVGSGNPVRQDQDCVIPYWSIVLPLTLFSTFLLLSKPKTSNLKKIAEPVTN